MIPRKETPLELTQWFKARSFPLVALLEAVEHDIRESTTTTADASAAAADWRQAIDAVYGVGSGAPLSTFNVAPMFYIIELLDPQMWYTDRGWSALPNEHVVRFGSEAAATDRAKHESLHSQPTLPLIVREYNDGDPIIGKGRTLATVKMGRVVPVHGPHS